MTNAPEIVCYPARILCQNLPSKVVQGLTMFEDTETEGTSLELAMLPVSLTPDMYIDHCGAHVACFYHGLCTAHSHTLLPTG